MEKVDLNRQKAFKILWDVFKKNAYANLAIDAYFGEQPLREVDRGFVSEIVYGTLRYVMTLDSVMQQFSKIKKNKISDAILIILRMGIYQLLFMRVPASAACNESVKLAKKYGHKASAGFVNGVLRSVAKGQALIILQTPEEKYSFPAWMVRRFSQELGYASSHQLMEALNERPKLCIRRNSLLASQEVFEQALQKEGIPFERGLYVDEAYYIKGHPLEETEAFRKGYFYVQDESSMLPAKVLAPKATDRILDICAAPGGKTSFLAALMQNEGEILACDLHPHRLLMMHENFKRLGVRSVETKVMDAAVFDAALLEKFEGVLCDVPCSGLGILRKKPEIKWARTEEDIASLAALQGDILKNCASYVKPGGTLVYSTCTLLTEENESVVEKFLALHTDFFPEPVQAFLPQKLVLDAAVPYAKIYPHLHGIDGFFIARLRKRKTVQT